MKRVILYETEINVFGTPLFSMFLFVPKLYAVTVGYYTAHRHSVALLCSQFCLYVPYCDESKQGPVADAQ